MFTFRYLKKCRVCEEIYYNNIISEDQFLNLADNHAITLEYESLDDGIHGTATIMSKCNNCIKVVNSPLA
jgi:hypothetical protein